MSEIQLEPLKKVVHFCAAHCPTLISVCGVKYDLEWVVCVRLLAYVQEELKLFKIDVLVVVCINKLHDVMYRLL